MINDDGLDTEGDTKLLVTEDEIEDGDGDDDDEIVDAKRTLAALKIAADADFDTDDDDEGEHVGTYMTGVPPVLSDLSVNPK